MGYGCDRGGGRENKKGSLRKSTKNPGCATGKASKNTQATVIESPISLPAPPLQHGASLAVDCSVALLSRKLDPTRESLGRTSKEYGTGAMIAWCSEIEKQKTLLEASKKFAATEADAAHTYCALGVHPDNVDRTNKKEHEGWLQEISQLAKAPTCVAVLTGLNLTREMNTHYGQEALLKDLCKLATEKLQLPVMIQTPKGDADSLERALELALPLVEDPKRLIVADVLACRNAALVGQVAESGAWATISGTWLNSDVPEEEGADAINQEAAACVKNFPVEQMLLATNSPWSTPQTLEEEHMRMLPNEPCNLVDGVAKTVASLKDGIDLQKLIEGTTANAVAAFRLGATPAAAPKEAPKKQSACSDEDEANCDEESDSEQPKDKAKPSPTNSAEAKSKGRLGELTMEELLAQAAAERERLQEEEAKNEEEDLANKPVKTKEKKKNVKASNKSNMGNYRNKDMRLQKTSADSLEAQLANLKDEDDSDDDGGRGKRGKKGKRRNKHDD